MIEPEPMRRMEHWPEMARPAFSYYRRLARLRDRVQRARCVELTLSEAAAITGLERRYFSAFFQLKVGMAFTTWRDRVRIRLALALMAERNYSMTEVADRVGFTSLRTFERVFKRYTLKTPSDYRRAVRHALATDPSPEDVDQDR